MLTTLWQTLANHGQLLYATCSVLPHENEQVIESFLKQTPDARSIPITAHWGRTQTFGRQILTGQDNMDGFYYALLEKHIN
jgi:16S rRNA (cytosine967-C5)-methyltransferase